MALRTAAALAAGLAVSLTAQTEQRDEIVSARDRLVSHVEASASNLPTPVVTGVAVYFPPNGRFYVMGGRAFDASGSELLSPYEYDRYHDAWKQKIATYPDNQVNDMACGVLTILGGSRIVCVGGFALGKSPTTARVLVYDPIGDSIAVLPAADNWPGNGTGAATPGGFAVVGNKFYIIGGLNYLEATNQTWEFDAGAASGSRWTLKANYPVSRGYVPATSIGGLIYTAGGSSWDGMLYDYTTESYKYDPVGNTWSAIMPIPRPTGATRAVTVGGLMLVLGGGWALNEVDVYEPRGNRWIVAAPFTKGVRNAAADTDGYRILRAGGYDDSGGGILSSAEIYLARTVEGTTSGGPTWQRPDANGSLPPNTLSGVGTAVAYSVTRLTVAFGGVYTFQCTALSPSHWDNYTFLYRNSFNPGTPLTNVVVGNDDNPTIGISGFTVPLASGTYFFVVSGYANGFAGDWTVTVMGGAIVAVPFTDDPIVTGAPVRVVHITELRSRIDALRARLGLAGYGWTDPIISPQSTEIKAQHILDLRSAVTDASLAAGLGPLLYTDPDLGPGTAIKSVHVAQLRSSVLTLE